MFVRLTGKNSNGVKVWNIGNVVEKAMLKGTNVADTNALETPIMDPRVL